MGERVFVAAPLVEARHLASLLVDADGSGSSRLQPAGHRVQLILALYVGAKEHDAADMLIAHVGGDDAVRQALLCHESPAAASGRLTSRGTSGARCGRMGATMGGLPAAQARAGGQLAALACLHRRGDGGCAMGSQQGRKGSEPNCAESGGSAR